MLASVSNNKAAEHSYINGEGAMHCEHTLSRTTTALFRKNLCSLFRLVLSSPRTFCQLSLSDRRAPAEVYQWWYNAADTNDAQQKSRRKIAMTDLGGLEATCRMWEQ